MLSNRQFPEDLVTFTEEILNVKLPFLCGEEINQLLILKRHFPNDQI